MRVRSWHWGTWATVGAASFVALEWYGLRDGVDSTTLTGRLRRFSQSRGGRTALVVALGAAHGWAVDHLLHRDGNYLGERTR